MVLKARRRQSQLQCGNAATATADWRMGGWAETATRFPPIFFCSRRPSIFPLMPSQRSPLRITRSGVVGTLIVLLVAGACVRLGFWQLSRLHQRRVKNAQIEARITARPSPLTSLRDTSGLLYRRVVVTGRLDSEHSIVLAGRSYKSEPGVYLITPLKIETGPEVLINRGWLPTPDAATIDLKPFSATTSGPFQGIVLPFPPAGGEERGPAGFRRVLFRFNESVRARFPYALAGAYVQALPEPGSGIRPTRLPPPELDDGPHLSYTIQWFSFAAIALVGWTILLARRGS